MPTLHAVSVVARVVFALALTGCAVLPRVPGDGLYNGELCTAAAGGPLDCGAADVSLSNGLAKVRVSDFVYDLSLDHGQVEVTLVHGRMLVDVWNASYSWAFPYLRFIDQGRRTFYRVRFANPPAHPGAGGLAD